MARCFRRPLGVGALLHGLLDCTVDGSVEAVRWLDDPVEAHEDGRLDEGGVTSTPRSGRTASARTVDGDGGRCGARMAQRAVRVPSAGAECARVWSTRLVSHDPAPGMTSETEAS